MPQFPSKRDLHIRDESSSHSVQFHFLGTVAFDACLALQRRLVYESGGHDDGRITVLLCEHSPLIGVGRAGSRGHIRMTSEQLRSRQLEVRWIGRGGGCVLHAPGQLAIYPIVPLDWHGWTVGRYMRMLQQAILNTLEELRIRTETTDRSFGIWGRSGQLAAFGAAVRGGVTCHGAFVNVNPMMTPYSWIDVVDPRTVPPSSKTTMGCLLAERRQAITIPKVRATLVPNLAAAFGTDQYHLITGHALLPAPRKLEHRSKHRAS